VHHQRLCAAGLFENHNTTSREAGMENLTITDEALVPDGCECPHCGERRIDYLVLDEDEWVMCESCSTEYPI
jgi:hypothetical protein